MVRLRQRLAEQDGKLVPVHQTAEYKEALD